MKIHCSPEEEKIARVIALAHFGRKHYTGWAKKSDRDRYLVDMYWKQWVPDAKMVIEAMSNETEKKDE